MTTTPKSTADAATATGPWRLAEALAQLPGPAHPAWPDGARFVTLLERDGLALECYAPQGHDPQQPHDRDELYVIAQGRSGFEQDGRRVEVGPGDVLFVPAWQPHRFVDFDAGFATWVVFAGPQRPRPGEG